MHLREIVENDCKCRNSTEGLSETRPGQTDVFKGDSMIYVLQEGPQCEACCINARREGKMTVTPRSRDGDISFRRHH